MSYNIPAFRQGIVIAKDHPTLKMGQIVYIIEETPDLYRVKLKLNCTSEIISKNDLKINDNSNQRCNSR